jgi:hypothetical protein
VRRGFRAIDETDPFFDLKPASRPMNDDSGNAAFWMEPGALQDECAADPAQGQDLPGLLSRLYEEAAGPARARLLEDLLTFLGPLAIAAVAAGAFRHLLFRARRDAAPIAEEDAAAIRPRDVLALSRFIDQCNPQALAQVRARIADRSNGAAPAELRPTAPEAVSLEELFI